jgi:PKD repeat protein
MPLFNFYEMKIIILYMFSIISYAATAQKHDAIWKPGGYGEWVINGTDTTKMLYSTYLDFHKSSPPPDSIAVGSHYVNISYANFFCDSLGKPRVFTNGMQVHHAKGPIFIYGDSLQPSYDRDNPFGPGPFYIGTLPGNMIVLPTPGLNDDYYILNHDADIANERIGRKSLLYTHLKGVDSDSTGYIAEKNIELLHRKYLLPIDAIKHANGRDWWILAMENDSIPTKFELNTFLLTPNGIEFVQKQFISDFEPTPGSEYWFMHATPDGNKIAMSNHRCFYILDFDRCSGLVTNFNFQVHATPLFYTTQFAFSPNSRFMYIPSINYLAQFDLQAANIEASKEIVAQTSWETVVNYVGYFTQDTTRREYNFYLACELAMDGKIYATGNITTKTTYVSNPNKKGTACHVIPFGASTRASLRATANHPYFRLGPIDGSQCDSLGLDNKPLADFWWSIDPDSTGNKLFVEFIDNSSYEPAAWRWWFQDGTGQISTDTNTVHIFPGPGIYEVCMEVCNQNACDTICKLVPIGQTSAVAEIERATASTRVFPNPAETGFVTIEYQLKAHAIDINIWNENGLPVAEQSLPKENIGQILLDVSPLPSGMYFYRMRDEEGGLVSGKVLVIKK